MTGVWSDLPDSWSELKQTSTFKRQSQGFSLIGFLCTLSVMGLAALLLIRGGPSVLEYWAIEKAVKAAAAMSGSPAELRAAYDKLASVGYIDAVQGKDLLIEGTGDAMSVSFSYEKRIHLTGPASLLIEYRGNTGGNPVKAAN